MQHFNLIMLFHGGIPIFLKNWKKKKNLKQNKCICFCHQLDKIANRSKKDLETINWLPIKERFDQCISNTLRINAPII